jgi:hypothetical protein
MRSYKFPAIIYFIGAVVGCVGFLVIGMSGVSYSDGGELPGGRPQDVQLAINNPDEYSWRLFLGINRQGLNGSPGEPDPAMPITKYDDDSAVVWETWALASGGRHGGKLVNPTTNYSEVYLNDGAKPLEWGKWPRSSAPEKAFESLPAQIADALRPVSKSEMGDEASIVVALFGPHVNSKVVQFAPTPDLPEGNEVRMNRSTYNFIRDNELYSVEGLEAEFRKETAPDKPSNALSFPLPAQEVKAQWRPIRAEEKSRYHWRMLKVSGTTKLYGLVAIHIMTKDLPNWFWCTFVQEDYDRYPEMQSFDTTTKKSGGIRPETIGSKWSHYRLRGSQIDFTDSRGRYTALANPVIEHGFQQTSSCITCHSRASVGLRTPDTPNVVKRLDPLKIDKMVTRGIIMTGPVGPTDPHWFLGPNGDLQYIQTDFVWSAPIRALSNSAKLGAQY